MLKPFTLKPTYRDYVWGGSRLRPDEPVTAEAWVIYEENKVAMGEYTGQTLAEVAEAEGEILLGIKNVAQTGKRFPLLIKLLDCARWLSLQVHPDNDNAELLEGPGHFGKTEAWHIVEAEEGAELISGFKEGVTRNEIREAVGKSMILDLVARHKVHTGDTIFMSPGTIHALGPGLLIYEVQQTSDLTYRVFDWDRPTTGRRQLHIDQAIEVLNPDAGGNVLSTQTEWNKTHWRELIACEYFSLDLISGITGSLPIEATGESFSAYTVLDGILQISGDGWEFELGGYDSLLIPAACKQYSIEILEHTLALHAHVA